MPEPIAQGFRLSPQQRRLWLLQRGEPGFPYRCRCALHIDGPLDRAALAGALADTVAAHEILRTSFPLLPGMSLPLQVIQSPRLPALEMLETADPGAAFEELEAAPAYATGDDPLHAGLSAHGPDQHLLLLSLPSLCADSATFSLLAAELLRAYLRRRGDCGDEAAAPLQFADVAEWQNQMLESEDTAEGVNRWREAWRTLRLGERLTERLPFEFDPPQPGFAPAALPVPLCGDLDRLLGDARFGGTAAKAAEAAEDLFLAAWQTVLWRSTGRDECLVGVLHHCRGYEELATALGPLARHLPVPGLLAPQTSFIDAVKAARSARLDALERQEHFGWEAVTGWRGEPDEAGFFPAAFEPFVEPWELAGSGLRLTLGFLDCHSEPFTVALAAGFRSGALAAELLYDSHRVQRTDAERLAGRLAAVLATVAARPEVPLGDIEAFAPGERDQVISAFAHGAAVPAETIASTLHQRFEEQADRTPGHTAVVWAGEDLTYRELDRRANRLAWHLKALGVAGETLVALCLERSSRAIAAVLGVLKVGGAYVPLDPAHPPERLGLILNETGAPVVITESQLAAALPQVPGVRVVLLDAEAEAIADRPDARPDCGAGPRNAAYAIYTSGSTGRPKGVLVEHRSPLNLHAGLEAAIYSHSRGSAPLRASQNAPLIFDASVQQLVLLVAGHTLVVVPEEVRSDGPALLAFLREQRIDAFDCTPSQLRLLVGAGLLTSEGAPALVLAAGEAVDPALWAALAGCPRTVFHNIYGPTECTVDATARRIGPENGPPSIGRPLAGYTVRLLDAGLRPVPIGAPGEICVSGSGLARGYVRRPDATAERFVPDPLGEPGGRLYRTGDLGRWQTGGEIEFLGRIDQQVKIRGYRIEPGEIEAALTSHPWVREAAVVARPGPGDSPILVAYPVPDPATPTTFSDSARATAELQGYLRERLPAYMVPSAFVLLPALPRTASGKVDRRALPAPDLHRRGLGSGYVPPTAPLEQLLAAIWEELLGVAPVGLHDSFFDLGGHSLLATQLISRVRDALHLELPVRRLFDGPTVAELAEAVAAASAAGSVAQAPPIVPVARDRDLPLSFGQQRLWFLQQLDPASHAYNTPFALRLTGGLDVAALAWTLEQVVRRHEILRTTIRVTGGEPVQVIAPPRAQPLPLVDLSGLPPAAGWGTAQRLTAEEALTPFDLSRLPVVRLRLLRLDPGEHVLLFTIHHVSGDGWSTGVLTHEVVELYAARTAGRAPDLPELPVQYADFAVWQREWLQGEVLEAQIAYWRSQLADAPPLLELATDRPRPPVPSDASGRVSRDLSPLRSALEDLGRREGATAFMSLLAAWSILLQRYSGQSTVVVGTPIANRNRRETEGLIGYFANTLALRTDLGDDPTFRALLRRVRETALGAYAHQDLPFEKLVDELQPPRDMSHAPIFQVMLVHQTDAGERLALGDLALSGFGPGAPAARFDLTLTCSEQEDGLLSGIDFSADLFDADTVERMLRLFAGLLSCAIATPDRPISELPLLDASEREEMLAGWSSTARELAPGGSCLHQLFERHAAVDPHAPALLWQGEAISYGELNARAESLARRLRALGVGPEVRAGLACERSPGALTGILAVLKAGGAYVPLDPGAPRERLEAIAADAGLAVLLTQERFSASLAGLAVHTIDVDGPAPAANPDAGRRCGRPCLPSPDNAAYVVYTSGSTGAAKGVVATHRNAVNFALALAGSIDAGAKDRFFLFAPLSFDASVLQIFVPLSTGGALAVHPDPRQLAAHEILALCERYELTVLDLPAALWRQWVEEVAASRQPLPASLRTFLTGGESVSRTKLQQWAGLTEKPCRFLSSYGPTEATVTATVFVTTSDRAAGLDRPTVPIGRPLPNVRCFVLDEWMQPVPRGVPGDLYLAGAGLTRGYLGRPDLTADAFRPDPLSSWGIGEPGGRVYRTGDLAWWLPRVPEGQLEFLGRADDQVKVRGFRIETGEIETALATHPAVRQCVVAIREDDGDRRLAAYLVAGEPHPDPAELRVLLARRLPDYMIPSSFTFLERLPVLPTGKVDRAALPVPDRSAAASGRVRTPPRNAVEEVLAGLFASVLRVEQLGVEEDFFALGGHSLLAAQLAGRVRDALETEIELRLLFEAPTVAGLAEALARDPAQRERLQRIAEVTLEISRLGEAEVEEMLASGEAG